MAKVIAIANQKGGVGKTTTTVHTAHALTSRGKKVLAIDIDPQASLTFYFGKDERELEMAHKTLYYSLIKDRPLAELVVEGNPALIPSSIMLSKADPELMSEPGSSWVLKERLDGLRDAYDFILIDCPPTLTLLTVNALSAADAVLIPVKTDTLSTLGIPLLLDTIRKIRRRGSTRLEVLGILPTMYNAQYGHDRETLEELCSVFAGEVRIFEPIKRSTAFDRAAAAGGTVQGVAPNTPGIEAYHQLADSIIAYAGHG
jgi:chromosome partitioning protein